MKGSSGTERIYLTGNRMVTIETLVPPGDLAPVLGMLEGDVVAAALLIVPALDELVVDDMRCVRFSPQSTILARHS